MYTYIRARVLVHGCVVGKGCLTFLVPVPFVSGEGQTERSSKIELMNAETLTVDKLNKSAMPSSLLTKGNADPMNFQERTC